MNPTEFADVALNWKAFDYQKAPLNDMHKRQIMACGRQVGKVCIVR